MPRWLGILIFLAAMAFVMANVARAPADVGTLSIDEPVKVSSLTEDIRSDLVKIRVRIVLLYYQARDVRRRVAAVERRIVCSRELCA